jgi:hypothetical protein
MTKPDLILGKTRWKPQNVEGWYYSEDLKRLGLRLTELLDMGAVEAGKEQDEELELVEELTPLAYSTNDVDKTIKFISLKIDELIETSNKLTRAVKQLKKEGVR